MQNVECHIWEVGNWLGVGLRSRFVGRGMCGLSVEWAVCASIEVPKIFFLVALKGKMCTVK